jgi:YVTN family beta-propeller protein
MIRKQEGLGFYLLQLPQARTVSAFVELYRSHPDIAAIEPNPVVSVKADQAPPNDPLFSSQWALERIGARKAWETTRSSDQVTVAVIDTGIDWRHPDLAGKLVPGRNVITRDGNTEDDHGHGTAVAGVIGAATNNGVGMAGVCWDCRLMPIKALDAQGEGTYADVIDAIVYAVDHGARVLNLSFGGYAPSQMLAQAIEYARSAGVVLVAAAGNEGSSDPIYPAAYPGVIAVSATDRYDAIWPSSNQGSYVSLSAPGVGILATALNGQYAEFSGTSLAAAHVSGVGALLLSQVSGISNTQAEQYLCRTAEDLGEKGKDPVFGYGNVNAATAVEFVGGIVTGEKPPAAPLHDLAVTRIRLEPPVFKAGDAVRIIVAVRNLGTSAENLLEVRALADDQPVGGSKIIATLAAGQSGEAAFDWLATGGAKESTNVISGHVVPVPGETDIANNTLTLPYRYDADGTVHVLYKSEPYVHSWVAYQAFNLLRQGDLKTELASHLYGDPAQYAGAQPVDFLFAKPDAKKWPQEYPESPWKNSVSSSGASVVEGTWEEDHDYYRHPIPPSYCWHFWDPDRGYRSGLDLPGVAKWGSNLEKALQWWSLAVGNYKADPSLSYYYLGRVIHLLGDLAVPEHVHNDLHLGGELPFTRESYSNYEMYTGLNYPDYAVLPNPTDGPKDLSRLPLGFPAYGDGPSQSEDFDPDLAKLFYNQAQFTQYFDSSDANGNDLLYGGAQILLNTGLNASDWIGRSRRTYLAVDYLNTCGKQPVDEARDNFQGGIDPGTDPVIEWQRTDDLVPTKSSQWKPVRRVHVGPGSGDDAKYYVDLSRALGQVMYSDSLFWEVALNPWNRLVITAQYRGASCVTESYLAANPSDPAVVYHAVPDANVKAQADVLMPENFRYVAALYQLFWNRTHGPTVISQRPASYNKDTDIIVEFSNDIDEATLSDSAVSVVGAASGLHPWVLTYRRWGYELTIDPATDFVAGEEVTVTLSTAVKDTTGRSLVPPAPLRFTILGGQTQGVVLALRPTSATLIAGGALQTISASVSRTNYAGAVTVAVSGLPPGVSRTIVDPGTGNSGTVTLQAAATATLVSNQPVTTTASGTGVAPATATLSLSVTAAPSCGNGNAESFPGLPVHPAGTLVKTGMDPKVYVLRGADSHMSILHRDWLQTEDVLYNPYNQSYSGPQFGFKDVIIISEREMGLYPFGGTISAPFSLTGNGRAQPDGKLIRQVGTIDVFIVTLGGQRRRFPTEPAFLQLGFLFCNVVEVNDISSYPEVQPPVTGTECSYSLSSNTQSFAASGGAATLNVIAGSSCSWTAVSAATAWLSVTYGAAGTGNGSVSILAAANTGSGVRVGMLTIAGHTVTVTQAGGACAGSIWPASASYGSGAATGSASVTTGSGCSWTASSNASWLTITSGGSGTGDGPVSYSLTANSGSSERTGLITVQSGSSPPLIYTVSQSAASPTCTYSIEPASKPYDWYERTDTFLINAPAGCAWQASSTDGWISIYYPSNGQGSGMGPVAYSVTANMGTTTRVGTVTVRGGNTTAQGTIRQDPRPGGWPAICLPVTATNLGNVLVDSRVDQTVVVQNQGTAPLSVTAIQKYVLSGNDDFSLTASLSSLPAGGTGSFTVSFRPTARGTASALFRIASNDPNTPWTEFRIYGTGVSTQDQPPIDFVWSNKSTAPEARTESAVAVMNNKIYVLGGNFFKRNYSYDPSIDAWTRLADAPHGAQGGGAAAIGDKIYTVGMNWVQLYDPATDSWITRAAMLTPREGFAVAAVNGKLYAIGGGGTGVVEQYDPATNAWTAKASMPTARDYAAAAVVGNQIYIVGGRPASGSQERIVEVYDPATDTWSSSFEAMPSRRDFCATAVLHDNIYVIGGSAYNTSLNRSAAVPTVEEFDPLKPHPPIYPGSSYTWSYRNPITFSRFFAVAAVANDKVYVIGGTNDTTDPYGVDVLAVEEGALSAAPDAVFPVTAASFGDLPVGTIGERAFSVQNRGNARLSLGYSRKAGGSDYQVFRMPAYLDPGQSGNVKIRFAPTSVGAQDATFEITSNDPDTPAIDLSVSGTGTANQPPLGGTWQPARTIQLSGGRGAHSLAISDGKAYVTRNTSVTTVDLDSGAQLADVAVTSESTVTLGYIAILGNKAYVPLVERGQLAIINRDSSAVEASLPVGDGARGTATYGGRVFVTNSIYGAPSSPLKVLDASTNSVIASIPAGMNPGYVALDAASRRGYVANSCGLCEEGSPSLSVSVFDSATNQVIATVPMPSAPHAIAIVGGRAYVTTDGASVEVIDVASNAVISSIPVATPAWGVAATPDYAFVQHTRQVTVIGLASQSIVGVIPLAFDAGGVAVDPASNNVYVTSQTDATITALRQVAPAFALSCTPATFSFPLTGAAASSCTVTSADGFSSPVSLTCSELPVGASCNFVPSEVTPAANGSITSTLTVTASSSTTLGAYNFQAGGTSGGITRTFGFTLEVGNPAPVVTSLSPASAAALEPGFTLTVNGSSFVQGSAVLWNGSERRTTFVSSTQLIAAIPATDITAAGTAQVTAFSLPPGGGTSSPLTFTVTAPVTYLVGDVFPLASLAGDLDGDGDTLDVGEFGDEGLNIVDLIHALRAVTGIVVPPACSDRFDAMDAYPVDTETTRGGDTRLSILDLIITLRRVTGVDINRPRRYSRNLVCPASAGLVAMRAVPESGVPGASAPDSGAPDSGGSEGQAARVELGAVVKDELGRVRIPLYLVARSDAMLAGAALAVGLEGESRTRLRFVPNDAFQAPSLVDDGVPGVLALAWLEGFRIAAGQRVLLGWVEAAATHPVLRIYGFDAQAQGTNPARGEAR